jgi:hypothetical protein
MTKLLLACGIVLVSTMAQADWVYQDKGGGRICTLRNSTRCFAEQPRVPDWRNPYPGDMFRHVPGMAPLPKDHAYQWTGGRWRDVRLQGVPGDVWDLNDRVRGVMPDNAPAGYEWAQGEDNDWKLKREGPSGMVTRRMYTADDSVIDVKMPDHWDPNRVKYTGAIGVRVYTEQQVAAARSCCSPRTTGQGHELP